MGNPQVYTVPITTIADGSATGYTPAVHGQIVNVVYTKDDFADTADFAITTEDTAQGVWTEANVTASKTVSPRQATHTTAGVAALYAAAGVAVLGPVYAVNERVKIVIAQGGDTKSGTFKVILV